MCLLAPALHRLQIERSLPGIVVQHWWPVACERPQEGRKDGGRDWGRGLEEEEEGEEEGLCKADAASRGLGWGTGPPRTSPPTACRM